MSKLRFLFKEYSAPNLHDETVQFDVHIYIFSSRGTYVNYWKIHRHIYLNSATQPRWYPFTSGWGVPDNFHLHWDAPIAHETRAFPARCARSSSFSCAEKKAPLRRTLTHATTTVLCVCDDGRAKARKIFSAAMWVYVRKPRLVAATQSEARVFG